MKLFSRVAFAVLFTSAIAAGVWRLHAAGRLLQPASQSAPRLLPCAVVEGALRHDFGVMDVGACGVHTLRIRNAGDAPLVVRPAGTSCQCTLLDAPTGAIEPGEAGQVRLEWTTDRPTESFRHGAVLHTNDPRQPRIELQIDGVVRAELGASPTEIILGEMLPGEKRKARVLVYSQQWKEFSLRAPRHDDGVEWTACPATGEQLKTHDALSGYELSVEYSAGGKAGPVFEHLSFVAMATNDCGNVQRHYRLPIIAEITSAIRFYGKSVDRDGRMRLGLLRRGEIVQRTIYVQSPPTGQAWRILQAHSSVDFLTVEVDDQPAHRHAVRVQLRAPSEPVSYRNEHAATIRLITDNAAAGELTIPVEFAVY